MASRSSRFIRWTHWLNALLLPLMIWSGILIYWADDAFIPIPDRLAVAIGINNRLAEGMAWHFTAMWLYAITGFAYVGYLLASGAWRGILPGRIGRRQGDYSSPQRLAYSSAALLGLGSIVTGIAIYKPVQAGWLTTLLGGYRAARLGHFACMIGLSIFVAVHLAQVAREAARRGLTEFSSMIPGARALAGIAAFGAVGLLVYFVIQKGPLADGAPSALRGALLFNERVFGSVHSNSRLARARPRPEPGKAPRVNGFLGLYSPVELEAHTVQVESGETRLTLPLRSITMLPKTSHATDFYCIEGWSEVMSYAGTRFTDFLEAFKVGRKPDGSYFRYVYLETPDAEYYVSIDIESMLHPQTLLAYEMNDAPLSLENGAPIRLIIPIKYGIKSLKRIGRIVFSDSRPPDYWAEQGYDWWAGL